MCSQLFIEGKMFWFHSLFSVNILYFIACLVAFVLIVWPTIGVCKCKGGRAWFDLSCIGKLIYYFLVNQLEFCLFGYWDLSFFYSIFQLNNIIFMNCSIFSYTLLELVFGIAFRIKLEGMDT